MFKSLFKRRGEDIQAAKLYTHLLLQSRKTEFFGSGRIPDTYDGRIGLLAVHQALMILALNDHGEGTEPLRQALFDVMIDDFNIALREEGISDTGIAKRIKPIVGIFYARVQQVTDGLKAETDLEPILAEGLLQKQGDSEFTAKLARYIEKSATDLQRLPLSDLQSGKFTFSELI